MKLFELSLPVFKQGDDLAHCIKSKDNDFRAAFEQQASYYDEAARLCRRMAGVAAEAPSLEIHADTHIIEVQGPTELLEMLAREDVLCVRDYDDEGEDEEDSDEVVDEGDEEEDHEAGAV